MISFIIKSCMSFYYFNFFIAEHIEQHGSYWAVRYAYILYIFLDQNALSMAPRSFERTTIASMGNGIIKYYLRQQLCDRLKDKIN